ncbi:MAG: hypothetical protein PHE73_03435 [Sulfurovaceae bacterium]|nr:hypothetical protein [Sulfurovaceae bacterium]
MNIPIYRAKKIDSDEWVIGFFWLQDGIPCITEIREVVFLQHGLNYKIDPSTLAIHFPAMIDSKGNKIFASLSEEGKGGDIFIINDENIKYIAIIRESQLLAKQQGTYGSFIGQGYAKTNLWKIIEVQQ